MSIPKEILNIENYHNFDKNIKCGYNLFIVREYEDGMKFWYLNDKIVLKQSKWWTRFFPLKPYKDYIVVIWENGKICYKNVKGKLHRKNGPAVIWPNGYKEYWLDDKLHNDHGPAIEWICDYHHSYYLKGIKYSKEEYQKRTNYKTKTFKVFGYTVTISK